MRVRDASLSYIGFSYAEIPQRLLDGAEETLEGAGVDCLYVVLGAISVVEATDLDIGLP